MVAEVIGGVGVEGAELGAAHVADGIGNEDVVVDGIGHTHETREPHRAGDVERLLWGIRADAHASVVVNTDALGAAVVREPVAVEAHGLRRGVVAEVVAEGSNRISLRDAAQQPRCVARDQEGVVDDGGEARCAHRTGDVEAGGRDRDADADVAAVVDADALGAAVVREPEVGEADVLRGGVVAEVVAEERDGVGARDAAE